MKRFHVHIAVKDLSQSIAFYSKLFGAAPSLSKDDYAKWMLDDPRLNFAISARGATPGLNHLGFQVDSGDELSALREQAERADLSLTPEPGAACCYARSDKHWIEDPQGIAWENFHTLASIPVFGEPARPEAAGCCTPTAPATPAAKACCG